MSGVRGIIFTIDVALLAIVVLSIFAFATINYGSTNSEINNELVFKESNIFMNGFSQTDVDSQYAGNYICRNVPDVSSLTNRIVCVGDVDAN